MIDEAHIHEPERGTEPPRDGLIRRTRLAGPRGMIVIVMCLATFCALSFSAR